MDKQKTTTVYAIDPSLIDVMPGFNARRDFGDIDELAEQIRENGLMQPLTVIPKTVNGVERYTLIDGERRYRAISQLLDNGTDVGPVKAFILEGTESQEDLLTRQVMLNEGKRFTDYELATLCKRMRDELHLKNSEIARRLGKNPGHITYLLDMFCWDTRVQDMVKDGELSIMSAQRVFKAARAKYGKDSNYEAKAAEELVRAKEEKDRIERTLASTAPVEPEKPAVTTSEAPVEEKPQPVVQKPEKAQKKPKVEKKQKVSITNSDLYTDVKDTKEFLNGFKAVIRVVNYHKQKYGLEGLKVNIAEMYRVINESGGKMTLAEYIDGQCQNAIGGTGFTSGPVSQKAEK